MHVHTTKTVLLYCTVHVSLGYDYNYNNNYSRYISLL